VFIRAHSSLVAAMKRDAAILKPFGHKIEWQDDIKVPIGESIIQVQESLA
jgi:hypothetical protein